MDLFSFVTTRVGFNSNHININILHWSGAGALSHLIDERQAIPARCVLPTDVAPTELELSTLPVGILRIVTPSKGFIAQKPHALKFKLHTNRYEPHDNRQRPPLPARMDVPDFHRRCADTYRQPGLDLCTPGSSKFIYLPAELLTVCDRGGRRSCGAGMGCDEVHLFQEAGCTSVSVTKSARGLFNISLRMSRGRRSSRYMKRYQEIRTG